MKRFFPLCMALGLFAASVGCDAAKENAVEGAKDAVNEGMDTAVDATADQPAVVKDAVEGVHDKVEEATGAAE